MKTVIAVLLMLLVCGSAHAYSNETYYGADGSYQGSSQTNETMAGFNTTYYGSDGGYQGTTYRSKF